MNFDLCFLEVHCPTISSAHSELSTDDTAAFTTLTITCDDGYAIADGSTSISLECLSTGAWNEDYTQYPCEG